MFSLFVRFNIPNAFQAPSVYEVGSEMVLRVIVLTVFIVHSVSSGKEKFVL